MKQPKKELDCTTCGGCCGPKYDEETHVDLYDVDVRRLSPHYRRNNVFHGALMTRRTVKNGTMCIAFRGTVGATARCHIYEKRPTACRSFERGGKACLETRRHLGITA